MKKIIFASAIFLAVFQSCKEEKKEQMIPETESFSQETTPPTMENLSPTKEDYLRESQSKPLTSLALSSSSFNFGDVVRGQVVEHTYEITNTGKNPLIISQVVPACGCTAPDYTKEPILPGQKGKVVLKFDSSNFVGLQHKQAEVYANVEKAPIILEFNANVVTQ